MRLCCASVAKRACQQVLCMQETLSATCRHQTIQGALLAHISHLSATPTSLPTAALQLGSIGTDIFAAYPG